LVRYFLIEVVFVILIGNIVWLFILVSVVSYAFLRIVVVGWVVVFGWCLIWNWLGIWFWDGDWLCHWDWISHFFLVNDRLCLLQNSVTTKGNV
jgi:hypothetical protein